ncbi:MAG: MFS transporter, partial [Blastocatellia bacterium]
MTRSEKAVSSPVTFKQVIKNRQYFAIWLALLVSNFGDWLALLGLFSLVAYRMHGSPYQVSGVMIAFVIPMAFLGPVAGVFVDRWNIKRTMIASDIARAVITAALVFAPSLPPVYA